MYDQHSVVCHIVYVLVSRKKDKQKEKNISKNYMNKDESYLFTVSYAPFLILLI